MSIEQAINDALMRGVPLRLELEPAWNDVLARADRARARRSRRTRVVAIAAGVAAASALTAGGLALAGAFGPLHTARLQTSATVLTGAHGRVSSCALIGKRAGQVEPILASNGIGIEWRFEHWGTVVSSTPSGSTPGAVTGGTSDSPSSVPADSIVWDVTPDTHNRAFVFVEAANDPNAPTVSVSGCPDSTPRS